MIFVFFHRRERGQCRICWFIDDANANTDFMLSGVKATAMGFVKVCTRMFATVKTNIKFNFLPFWKKKNSKIIKYIFFSFN